jgi:cysteinyl-tRNA synthetase, unknown class
MKLRGQSTFEYVLLLGGVLLIVVIAMVTLMDALPGIDSSNTCAIQARSSLSCFDKDGAFNLDKTFAFNGENLACSCTRQSLEANPSFLPVSGLLPTVSNVGVSFETRSDGAIRITNPVGTASDQNPAFLDENRVLFTRFADGYNQGKATLVLLDVTTGLETTVVNDGGVAVSTSGNPFTPDKDNVCFSSDAESEDDVWCSSLNAGTPSRITQDVTGAHFIEPSVRFDGQRIAFEKHLPGVIDASNGEIWTTDFSGNVQVLLSDSFDNRLPQYHPNENKVLIQRGMNGVFRLALVDGETGQVTDAGIQTEEGTDASWTLSGGIVYSAEGSNLATPVIVYFKNDLNTQITQSDMLDSAPAASLNEKVVAFESRISETGSAKIWLIANPADPLSTNLPVTSPLPSPFAVSGALTGLYVLNGYDQVGLVQKIVDTPSDILIVDAYKQTPATPFSSAEVTAFKQNHPTTLAYLSIGEAEDYRYYWDASWPASPPTWMGKLNPEWAGNIKVKYWDPAWQTIIFDYVDRIVAQGFDGAYLDIIDGYEYWADSANGENEVLTTNEAATRMIAFIQSIRDRARQTNPNFKIFPQNAPALVQYSSYLSAMDGIGKEETWYGGYNELTHPNSLAQPLEAALRDEELAFLRAILQAGKTVIVTDYFNPNQVVQAQDFLAKAKIEGFAAYPADKRGLNDVSVFMPSTG